MRIILFFIFVLLTSCSGGGGSSSNNPAPEVNLSASKTDLLVPGNTTIQWSSNNSTSCLATGDWSGTYGTSGTEVINISSAGTKNFILTCEGPGGSNNNSISLSLNTDPLYSYQWHLKNTGQTNFASLSEGTHDLNIEDVISSGITGVGTIIAIVDTGLELSHEDLSANVVAGKSYDYSDQDNNPEPINSLGDHGTSIAGLTSAVGGNNIGVRGVAPNSKVVGFNVIGGSNNTISNMVDALGGASGGADTQQVDIFNMSFGTNAERFFPSPINSSIEAAFKNGADNLRNGKGAIYVTSAGNHWNYRENSNIYNCGPNYGVNNSAEGFPCWDSSFDTKLTVPYVIGVASLKESGVRSSYSTPGSSLWISGFGGEYGNNQSYTGLTAVGGNNPALMTTDQSSCSKGYVRAGIDVGSGLNINSFQSSSHPENQNCNYTSTANGTSAATPTISGVIALMLEANNNLTWRDVKHILASTSDQIDSNRQKTFLGVNQHRWIINAAGYKHHNWYGFGKINGVAAVEAARSYISGSLGTFNDSGWVSSGTINTSFDSFTRAIFNNSALNVTKPLSSNGKIEFIRVRISMTTSNPNHVGLELLSPDGTIVPILSPYSIITNNPLSSPFDIGISSLYGENISGDWKLIVSDYTNDGIGGVINSWQIRIYGN